MKLTPALLTVVMLLVVGGLVTAFVAKRMLAHEAVAQEEAINIPMALSDLQPGTVITEAHIGLAPARPSQLDREVLHTPRVVVGRVVRNPILRAQPIRTSDLYAPGERPPLDVDPGMRAVTVAVADEASFVDGLLKPGQFADVHFAQTGNGIARGGLVTTLFEGVKVLAINRNQTAASVPGIAAANVTLELTPEQAQVMLLATRRGNISLSYSPNGPGSGGIATPAAQRAALDVLLGLAPPATPFMTEIITGADRSKNEFEAGRMLQSENASPAPAPSTAPHETNVRTGAGRSAYWNQRRATLGESVSTAR